MKFKTLAIGVVFLIGGLPATLLAGTCKESQKKDTLCTLNVDRLHPAQFSVGSIAVTCKSDKISKKSKKKLKKYLEDEKRQVPTVIGPGGNYYITDHHHLATALHRASSHQWGDKQKVLYVRILDNYTEKDKTWGEFWAEMQQQHRSHNCDNNGHCDLNFSLIPSNLGGLLNDPYRTLSRWVRESCGYVKLGKEQCDHIRTEPKHEAPFFMEFFWGEFFREHLKLTVKDMEVCKSIPFTETCLDVNDEVKQLKAIYPEAMKLAKSDKAKEFFKKKGLDPFAYGFNPTGEHLKLKFSGYKDACEDPVIPGNK